MIASESPGTKEVIDDGKNGYLFPCGDYTQLAVKIVALRRGSDVRQSFISFGKTTIAERFSISSMISSFETIVESCDRV